MFNMTYVYPFQDVPLHTYVYLYSFVALATVKCVSGKKFTSKCQVNNGANIRAHTFLDVYVCIIL